MELGFAEHVWQAKRGAMAQEAVDDRAMGFAQPRAPCGPSSKHGTPVGLAADPEGSASLKE